MIKVSIKTSNRFKFSVPVPYALLNVAVSIASSPFIWRLANRKLQLKEQHLPSTLIDKQVIEHFIQSLKKEKGLTIVDVKLQDGTEVMVRL